MIKNQAKADSTLEQMETHSLKLNGGKMETVVAQKNGTPSRKSLGSPRTRTNSMRDLANLGSNLTIRETKNQAIPDITEELTVTHWLRLNGGKTETVQVLKSGTPSRRSRDSQRIRTNSTRELANHGSNQTIRKTKNPATQDSTEELTVIPWLKLNGGKTETVQALKSGTPSRKLLDSLQTRKLSNRELANPG